MRPAAFDYFAPTTLDEAVACLADRGPEARILAGGQSLIPAMNLRLARPGALIDIGRVPGLDDIQVWNGSVTIGTKVTHAAIEGSAALSESLPVLPAMARHIGHHAVRNRGTIGGSLAHADPASEWPCALVALGGAVTATGPTGERVIEAGDFFRSHFTTALAADEVLTKVEFPTLGGNRRWSFHEVARQTGAFGIVLALAVAERAPDGTVANIDLALGGCGSTPIRPIGDWSFLTGQSPTAGAIDDAVARIDGAIQPPSDIDAGSEDRRQMARTLARRALSEALGLASGPEARP